MITRDDLVATARRCGIPDEELTCTCPGRTEGNPDRELANALDWLVTDGHADEDFGSADEGSFGHVARVNRWLVQTSSQGFVTVSEFPTEEHACERFRWAEAQAALDAEED